MSKIPKERDLLKQIFTNFYKSLFPSRMKKVLVGEDKRGTRYFEILRDSQRGRRPERWYEANVKNKKIDGFDVDLPAEWESWLRGRRRDAPTEEEIARNDAMRKQTRENAIEKGYVLEKREEKLSSFPVHPEYQTVPDSKQHDMITRKERKDD